MRNSKSCKERNSYRSSFSFIWDKDGIEWYKTNEEKELIWDIIKAVSVNDYWESRELHIIKEKNGFRSTKRKTDNIKTIQIVFTLLGVKSHWFFVMEFFTTGEALVKAGWKTLEGSVRRHTSLAASMVVHQVYQTDLKC